MMSPTEYADMKPNLDMFFEVFGHGRKRPAEGGWKLMYSQTHSWPPERTDTPSYRRITTVSILWACVEGDELLDIRFQNKFGTAANRSVFWTERYLVEAESSALGEAEPGSKVGPGIWSARWGQDLCVGTHLPKLSDVIEAETRESIQLRLNRLIDFTQVLAYDP